MSARCCSWILAGVLVAASAGAEERATSGFLGDRSQLEPGRADQAQLVYVAPEADFSGYTKVLVDAVAVWGEGAAVEAPSEELEALASRFGAALREQLQLEFELVEQPGPGTLRIRTALMGVSAEGASMEMEILDAASGERLVAVADAHGGSDGPGGEPPEERIAREAFEFWAKRARVRLAAFRSFDAAEAAHDAAAER